MKLKSAQEEELDIVSSSGWLKLIKVIYKLYLQRLTAQLPL